MPKKRTCPRCKTSKTLNQFYNRRNKPGTSVYCKPCTCEQTIERQRALKLTVVTYLGGCCKRCGYNKCIGALECHHRDPNQKDIALSNAKLVSFDKIKSELDKCDLLCANCHREAHYEMKYPRLDSNQRPAV